MRQDEGAPWHEGSVMVDGMHCVDQPMELGELDLLRLLRAFPFFFLFVLAFFFLFFVLITCTLTNETDAKAVSWCLAHVQGEFVCQ